MNERGKEGKRGPRAGVQAQVIVLASLEDV